MKSIHWILVILYFAGCVKDEYYNIPENERPIYQNGDELIYKSNTGKFDTLFITEKTNSYDIHDNRYYHEYISLNFVKSKQKDSFGSLNQRLNSISLSWEGVYFNTGKLQNFNLSTITINNKKYDNTYQFSEFIYYPSSGNNKIKTIYYNQKYCVIKYQYSNGETWELINY
jgi:hypothetical protein